MEYYRLPLYIFFGILPSVIWLLYYVKKDLHPEPKKIILKIFLYGALITIPTFFIQITLSELLNQLSVFKPFVDVPIIINLIKWFLVIALSEELLKYFVVKSAIFSHGELDEPLDIMLYMVIAALGFAALENVLYLFAPVNAISFGAVLQTTIVISFVRFIGATFLHTLCSALIGYFVVLAAFKDKHQKLLTLIGISLATVLHGLYNFSIISLETPFNLLIPIAIILGLAIFIFYDFDEIKKVKSICRI